MVLVSVLSCKDGELAPRTGEGIRMNVLMQVSVSDTVRAWSVSQLKAVQLAIRKEVTARLAEGERLKDPEYHKEFILHNLKEMSRVRVMARYRELIGGTIRDARLKVEEVMEAQEAEKGKAE
jgi:hypothetical protein